MPRSSALCALVLLLAMPDRRAEAAETADAPGGAKTEVDAPLCWAPPALALRRDQKAKLSDAINAAARAAQPEHSLRSVIELASAKSAATAELECGAVVVTTLVATKKTWTLSLALKSTTTASASAELDPRAPASSALEPAWRRLWRAVDPPKPPPPPVAAAEPPPPPEVDADLAREKAMLAPKPVVESPPRVRLMIATGMSLRNASSTLGNTLDHGPLLGLGGEATLMMGSWIGERHALDLSAGYLRRLAKVVIDDVDAAADADRFDVKLAYRYALAERGLSIGPQVGWELLRFELDPRAGALSSRYGVLRLGAEGRLPLVDWLELSAQGAVRVAPDGGVDPGFDLAGGPELMLGALTLRAWARYTQQTGDGFQDRQVDLELAVGARL